MAKTKRAEVAVDTERLVQPQNLDAEVQVLGAAMFDREAANQVVDLLERQDYYIEAHGLIHQAIADQIEAGQPADIFAVKTRVEAAKALDKIGGMAYLSELVGAVYTTANVEYHATLVAEAAARRRLIKAAHRVIALAYDQGEDLPQVLSEAERAIYDVGNQVGGNTLVELRDTVKSFFDLVERRAEGLEPPSISPGFTDLDMMLGGLRPGQLIVVGARPAMGKSAFALDLAMNVAKGVLPPYRQDRGEGRTPRPVVMFSLEMDEGELTGRVMSKLAAINSMRLNAGFLSEGDWANLVRAMAEASTVRMFMDDRTDVTLASIRSACRRAQNLAGPLGLVVVDYIQLMGGDSNDETRAQEVARLSRGLKLIAREFKVPVVALSQLNRAVESRTCKRPGLADLRESGGIEQDADVVMLLYRDEYYNPDGDQTNVAEVIIAKQRAGATGTVKLFFDKETTTFRNLSLEAV